MCANHFVVGPTLRIHSHMSLTWKTSPCLRPRPREKPLAQSKCACRVFRGHPALFCSKGKPKRHHYFWGPLFQDTRVGAWLVVFDSLVPISGELTRG